MEKKIKVKEIIVHQSYIYVEKPFKLGNIIYSGVMYKNIINS